MEKVAVVEHEDQPLPSDQFGIVQAVTAHGLRGRRDRASCRLVDRVLGVEAPCVPAGSCLHIHPLGKSSGPLPYHLQVASVLMSRLVLDN